MTRRHAIGPTARRGAAGDGGYAVTVVLPTYNGRRFVDQQINSILGQTYRNLFLIIVDDGSTDGTFAHLKARYGHLPNVSIMQNDQNLGQMRTLNRALSLVSTPYFAIADQDDVWLAEKIAESVESLEKFQVDLVYSDVRVVDEDLIEISASGFRHMGLSPVSGRPIAEVLIKNPVSGCTILGRSELLRQALPVPDGLQVHDRWLALVASAKNGIAVIRKPLMLYRQHGGNVVGGVTRSLAGLVQRVSKAAGGGGPTSYLEERLLQRRLHTRALLQLAEASPMLKWWSLYYELPMVGRLMLLVPYLVTTVWTASRVGVVNLLVDALFTGVAPSPGPRQRAVESGA